LRRPATRVRPLGSSARVLPMSWISSRASSALSEVTGGIGGGAGRSESVTRPSWPATVPLYLPKMPTAGDPSPPSRNGPWPPVPAVAAALLAGVRPGRVERPPLDSHERHGHGVQSSAGPHGQGADGVAGFGLHRDHPRQLPAVSLSQDPPLPRLVDGPHRLD